MWILKINSGSKLVCVEITNSQLSGNISLGKHNHKNLYQTDWFVIIYVIFLFNSCLFQHMFCLLNFFLLGDAYMCHWAGSSLFRVMACCLFSNKPLPETMVIYCQLDHYKQCSLKFLSKFRNFHWQNYTWRSHLPKWQPSCLRPKVLIWILAWLY